MTTIRLVCPHDNSLLEESGESYSCPECHRLYPVESGVVRLLGQDDTFYEGAYENQVGFLPRSEKAWHIWPLWLINSGYPWMVRKYVPEGSVIVELGCAGGVRYFGSRYRMIGCDLSFSSLQKLASVYEYNVQANAAECIPLPDGSVDAVVSSYFWEHIPPEVKPAILAECQRILRPGGKIIFLYDVETANPLIARYIAKDRTLYERLFIEGDGHYGYQDPADNLSIFNNVGFRVIVHRGLEKTWVQSPSVYSKLEKYEGGLAMFFSITKILGRSPWFYFYTGFMRLIDSFLCPLLPRDWARIDLVVCEKEVEIDH